MLSLSLSLSLSYSVWFSSARIGLMAAFIIWFVAYLPYTFMSPQYDNLSLWVTLCNVIAIDMIVIVLLWCTCMCITCTCMLSLKLQVLCCITSMLSVTIIIYFYVYFVLYYCTFYVHTIHKHVTFSMLQWCQGWNMSDIQHLCWVRYYCSLVIGVAARWPPVL